MTIDRRAFSMMLAALAGGATLPMLRPSGARAAALEELTIIAAASTGGGYDTLARTAQMLLQDGKLVGNVEVMNVPGAGGTVGLAQLISRGRPSTLLTAGLGMVGAVIINKSAATLSQTRPVARLQGEYQPLVVAAESPIKSLDDLVKAYKAEPGAVSWAGFGLGSPDHLVSAQVVKATGGDVREMNYIVVGAGSEMLPLVLSNQVTVATGGYNEFADMIATGKLRALGISSPERLKGIDVPTFREQGIDTELVNWRGLVGSAKLGDEEIAGMDEAFGAMAKSAAWNEICDSRGWQNLYMPSAEFTTFLAAEQTRITALLTELGLGG
ncbi:C4-dicarboxylate ABC transporter substrate-binding protein [Aureimonas sp. SA4125]|uniref:Bug family tripartite tricarboxylate transporter substrate binding protein n=1 Tax=Aureimonas sp. SA4125 TaxID=2826993 RepID=UPI001CC3E708|nr:tripartite tricarboxylate transporter substrate-binding protein [Aureimonas sp. SA4125]BDA83341.1 C4-dicarboxylate ABC transporter substrate-binding protein [Aureimonas sp. SA4125]